VTINGHTTVTVTGLFHNDINSGQFGLTLGLITNPTITARRSLLLTQSFNLGVASPNPGSQAIATTPGDTA
jgi:hypothetical protein